MIKVKYKPKDIMLAAPDGGGGEGEPGQSTKRKNVEYEPLKSKPKSNQNNKKQDNQDGNGSQGQSQSKPKDTSLSVGDLIRIKSDKNKVGQVISIEPDGKVNIKVIDITTIDPEAK